jgi:opacity protein-like surface antigen
VNKSLMLASLLVFHLVSQAAAQDPFFAPSSTADPFGGGTCAKGCSGAGDCSNVSPGGGRYLSVFGGLVDIDNFERTRVIGGSTFIDGAKLSDGWAGGGAIGRYLLPNVRGEFEFTYRDNSVKSWFEQTKNAAGVLTTNNSFSATGSIDTYSGMFNVLFDHYTSEPGFPGIFLGAGLGAIYADGTYTNTALPPATFSIQDSSFAYQFIVGLVRPVSDRLDLFTEYRYLGADYLNVDNDTTGVSLGDHTYDSHNVFFGVRIRR